MSCSLHSRQLCTFSTAAAFPQVFSLIMPRPTAPILFPYTTLFRSPLDVHARLDGDPAVGERLDQALVRVLQVDVDRKSTRLNSSHGYISYAVFCWKKTTNTLTMSDYRLTG